MSDKLKIKSAQLTQQGFIAAFGNLCGDTSLTIKDRYALGRCARQVQDWLTAYHARRDELVKKFGKNAKEHFTAELNALTAQILDAPEADKPVLAARRNSISAELARTNPTAMIIPPGTPELAEFNAILATETEGELELFLDHKVVLGAESKLAAGDLMELLDLVEEPK